MLKILREYIENDYRITEYTRDGEKVSHRVETPIPQEAVEEIEREQTSTISVAEVQLQTLLNTEYLVTMTQINK